MASPDKNLAQQMTARLAAVEKHQDALADSINRLSHALENQANKLDDALTALRQDVNSVRTPNWGVLITGAGVLLSVIAGIGGMALAPLYSSTNSNKEMVRTVSERMNHHASLESHPFTKARFNELHEAVAKLDQNLQREMRLLDENQNAEIHALEKKFQRELDALKIDLDDHRKLYDHPHGVIMKMKDLESRLDALSRKAKPTSNAHDR